MDPTPSVAPAHTLLGGAENMKLLFDTTMAILQQGIMDNQASARNLATLHLRMAHNAATIDHLAGLNVVISAQTGDTAGQQTVSPIRTAAGDNLAGGAAPANRITDTAGSVAGAGVNAGVAEAVQGNVTSQLAVLSETVSSLGGTITTALQALADSNALIASALGRGGLFGDVPGRASTGRE